MLRRPIIQPRFRFPAAVTLLLAAVVCGKLMYFERWLLDNDNFATLGTFFRSTGREDYARSMRRFYDVSVAACDPADARCVAYAGAVQGDQWYARPIIAFAGSQLVDAAVLSSDREFLRGVTRATILHVAVSAVLLGVLLAYFLSLLPRPAGTFIAATTPVFGILAYSLPEQAAFSAFQPLLGVSLGAVPAVLSLALAGAGVGMVLGFRQRTGVASRSSGFAVWFSWVAAAALVACRVAVFPFQAPALTVPMLQSDVVLLAAGLAVFLVAVGAALQSSSLPTAVSWVALFLLFGFVSTGENFFSTAFHIAPRGQVFLLTTPILVYTAFNPGGRGLWLLSAVALFHVSISALLFGCMVAIELIASLRRRTLSAALIPATICLAGAAVHTVLTGGNMVMTAQAMSVSGIAGRLDPLAFLPAVPVLALLAGAAYTAWRLPDPGGDLLLRAVVLAALVACAGQLRHALQSAGFDMVDPAAYNFIQMSYYLAPAVCAAGLFFVLLGLGSRPRTETGGRLELNGRALALATAGVLALAAVRSTTTISRPRNPLATIATVGRIVASHMPPPEGIEPLLLEAAAPNDRYIVGPFPGHPVTMTSILKMKARTTAGLLQPDRVSVVGPRPAS